MGLTPLLPLAELAAAETRGSSIFYADVGPNCAPHFSLDAEKPLPDGRGS